MQEGIYFGANQANTTFEVSYCTFDNVNMYWKYTNSQWEAGGDMVQSQFFRNPAAHEQTGVPLGIPLLPVQLMESAFDLLLCALLALLWRRRSGPDGTVFWIYILCYSVWRALIEFWRGDSIRGIYFGGLASTSQVLSLAGVLLAAAMLARAFLLRRRRAER